MHCFKQPKILSNKGCSKCKSMRLNTLKYINHLNIEYGSILNHFCPNS